MKLLVISDAPILTLNNKRESYAPYVREMDIWMRHSDTTTYVCPTKYGQSLLTQPFEKQDFDVLSIHRMEFHTKKAAFTSLLRIPGQFLQLCKSMRKADHIHMRAPGNTTLLACVAQILFPSKIKTAKYAGNWNPDSKQPFAYRLQKRILSNESLTKNMHVLVYGNWPSQTKNIKSFFTATYPKKALAIDFKKDWNGVLKCVFVGTMGDNKRPLLVYETCKALIKKGYQLELDYYGDGTFKSIIENRSKKEGFSKVITCHGNQSIEVVTKAYQQSHFVFLLSQSEGWPKALAEGMFWGCVPIASQVSCVPWMLGVDKNAFSKTQRGILIPDLEATTSIIEGYLTHEDRLVKMSIRAMEWSRAYTLDKFEEEIAHLLS